MFQRCLRRLLCVRRSVESGSTSHARAFDFRKTWASFVTCMTRCRIWMDEQGTAEDSRKSRYSAARSQRSSNSPSGESFLCYTSRWICDDERNRLSFVSTISSRLRPVGYVSLSAQFSALKNLSALKKAVLYKTIYRIYIVCIVI